jgi:hypothetical protein
MATGSTNTILQAMADAVLVALDTVTATENYSVQVEPHMVVSPTPPTVDFYPGDVARGTEALAFGGAGELLVTCRVRVNGNDNVENWKLLNDLMEDNGDLSIPAILDVDTTLAGYVTSLDFRDPTGMVLYTYGDQTLPGRQFTVVVVRADS